MPKNHGKPWGGPEQKLLLELRRQGCTHQEIAVRLGRSGYAIQCKLEQLNAPPNVPPGHPITGIEMSQSAQSIPIPTIKPELKEDNKMTNRTVTTKTFVGNRDASELSITQLVEVIEQEQGFIERLTKLPVSQAREKLLEKHKANLASLDKLLEDAL